MAELQQANKRAMFARISRMCTRGFARPSSVSNPLLLYAPGAPDLSLTQPGFNKAAGVIAINPFYERQGTTSARHLGLASRAPPVPHTAPATPYYLFDITVTYYRSVQAVTTARDPCRACLTPREDKASSSHNHIHVIRNHALNVVRQHTTEFR